MTAQRIRDTLKNLVQRVETVLGVSDAELPGHVKQMVNDLVTCALPEYELVKKDMPQDEEESKESFGFDKKMHNLGLQFKEVCDDLVAEANCAIN